MLTALRQSESVLPGQLANHRGGMPPCLDLIPEEVNLAAKFEGCEHGKSLRLLFDILDTFNILEVRVLRPKDRCMGTGRGKNNTICHCQFQVGR